MARSESHFYVTHNVDTDSTIHVDFKNPEVIKIQSCVYNILWIVCIWFFVGQFSPEEDERKKRRRERNKIAAAKCRNKKKEKTECLQKVSD